jgi:hypothetical protein
MFFKKKGEKTQFRFVNSRCIGRACWAPGNYQHRSPMSGGGSRNTGSPDTPCCLNNAYHGCPEGPDGARTVECHCGGNNPGCVYCGGTNMVHYRGLPEYDKEMAAKRKAEGWRAV